MSVSHLDPGGYQLRVFRTGFRANDAYSAYIDLGHPKDLTPAQLEQLSLLTRDLPEIDRAVKIGRVRIGYGMSNDFPATFAKSHDDSLADSTATGIS